MLTGRPPRVFFPAEQAARAWPDEQRSTRSHNSGLMSP